jgi:periodic tryptophan protein 2
LFDTRNSQQIGSIETKLDIDVGRGRLDKIKKTTLEKNKFNFKNILINQFYAFRTFTCIAFSPNGQFLLAGGQSNTFCLYSVVDRIRVRTFKLSHNLSLDGTAVSI